MASSPQPPFEEEWARCAHWIEAALHFGADGTTLEDVERMVRSGAAQFWPALDSAIVTQVCSKGQELNIYLAGGSLDRLRDMLPSIEAYGKQRGCQIVSILGRKGWERSFLTREAGYKAVAVLLGKELPDEQGAEKPQ